MTLHDAMRETLLRAGRPLKTVKIAHEVNLQRSYSKRDGSLVTATQIGARAARYPKIFIKMNGAITLVRWGGGIPEPPVQLQRSPAPAPKILPVRDSHDPSSDGLRTVLFSPTAFLPVSNVDPMTCNYPGIYAIRIRDRRALPSPFSTLAEQRGHDLLYVGIARQSLRTRLLHQELRGQGHGTFFRSVGAVLGYRPIAGSLVGKSNTKNYKFAPEDAQSIVRWINENLLVNWVACTDDLERVEQTQIREQRPLLNLQHNSAALTELSAVRAECVRVANSPIGRG